MYDIEKADKIYAEKLMEDPKFAEKLMDKFRDKMPEEFVKTMFEEEYGCHIVDRSIYDEAVSLLEWSENRGSGAKWTVDDILKLANIDFSNKDYYEFDYAYVVNMLWSDYGHIFTEPSYFLKMAKAYLEDPDYMGKPDERAYKNAIKRIEYFENK